MTGVAPPTAIVLHDAGAANHVLAWIDAGLLPADRVYAEGPAARLWGQKPRPALRASLADAMFGARSLVSGTGWASDLEHQSRMIAHREGVESHAVLDHWVNYPARFERLGQRRLPDTLWVADTDAQTIAITSFPGLPVRLMPDSYLQAQVAAIRAAEHLTPEKGALVILEPARDHWGRESAGEFQALDFLAANREAAGLPRGLPLRLRPHPSDPVGKYDEWMAANPVLQPVLDPDSDLAGAIAGSALILGLNSFALTIALAAGYPVLSILPPWAPPCVLPQKGIGRLCHMIGIAA